MTTDFRALCADLIASWDADGCDWKPQHQARWEATVARARTALADEPAVPEGREPASVALQPSDEELDDWHSRCADLTRLGEAEHYWAFDLQGEDVAAVARAAIARWGNPAPQPPAEPTVPTVMEIIELSYEIEAAGLGQVDLVRAALTRWGNPAPQPPAEGEVAELVAEIRHFLAGYKQMRGLDPENIYSIHRGDKMEAHLTVSRLTRAAELLQRLSPPQPVPGQEVSE